MEHDKISLGVLDREDLKWNAAGVVTKDENAIGLGRIDRRWLTECKPAMFDDVANPRIDDPVLARRIKNPDRQLATP